MNPISIRNKLKSITYCKTPIKLPFLTNRVRPSDFANPLPMENLTETDLNPLISHKKFRPRHESISIYSPSTAFSTEIPPLNYSSFQKPSKTRPNPRRNSEFTVLPQPLLQQKYKIPDLPALNLRQSNIKESIINRRVFKRIESSEIAYPSKTLGQKLVRVQELVIDPLMAEGEFN